MGKWLDRVIEKRESKDKNSGDIPKNNTDNTDIVTVPIQAVKGEAVFADLLTETERQYYHALLEIMQSKKFGMSQDAAKQEAGRIIARNRQPLQVKQAAQDYKKYGYCRIFSTVLELLGNIKNILSD